MESQKIPDIFIWAPPGRIQGLLCAVFSRWEVNNNSILSGFWGSLLYLWPIGFPYGEASYPCCESVIDALGLGAPSYPSRKQEGWRDSAQVFFHSPCFLNSNHLLLWERDEMRPKNRSLSASQINAEKAVLSVEWINLPAVTQNLNSTLLHF